MIDGTVRPLIRWALVIVLVLGLKSAPTGAHSMHQTAILLDFREHVVEAELQLPIDRLEVSFGPIDADHWRQQAPALREYLLTHVHATLPDDKPLKVAISTLELKSVEGSPDLIVQLALTAPDRQPPKAIKLDYDVIMHKIVTHVVLVYIRAAAGKAVPEDPILVGMLRGERKSIVVDLSGL